MGMDGLRSFVERAATAKEQEFMRLLELRDLAAYRAVSKIQSVLDFWEGQDFDVAGEILRSALAEFREADRAVNEFRSALTKKSTQGETPRYGNRTSNDSVA